MKGMPDIIFVVDQGKELIAIKEANKLNIPVICLADTNADPDGIDYLIPGNDDAIRSIKLVASKIADAVLEGKELRQNKATSGKIEKIEAKMPVSKKQKLKKQPYKLQVLGARKPCPFFNKGVNYGNQSLNGERTER